MFHFLEILFVPKSNAPEAAKSLADLLQVKITKTTLAKEIEGHPDYPSLLSISDVLKNYGIENLAIKLDPEKLSELPTPFVTYIRGEKSSTEFFTVVKEINESSISFFDPEKHKWTTSSRDTFLKRFTGTVLLAEAEEQAGEKEYDKNIVRERRKEVIQQFTAFFIPTIVLVAGVIAFMRNGISFWLPFAFLLLAFSGFVIAVLLLLYEFDQYNPVLQQICSAGKKVNCGAILQSKASKIAGISWSTIGFTYFTGQLLLLLFTGIINLQTLFILSWLNVLALPYIFFSIYYQYQVAKQWCVLCLCVQSILVLQFATALAGDWHSLLSVDTISPELLLAIIAAFTVPFISVAMLIPVLENAKESKNNKNELQRLKHNPQIFEALLAKQKAVTESTEGLGITLGNPDAKHKLIKVCNPYCAPCSKAHVPMEELLENNPDVQIQMIFTATNNEKDYKALPVKHLLAIAEKKDEALIKQALDDWYLAERNEYHVFASKYPMNGELKKQDGKIEAMSSWCDKTGIEFTPTFFVSLPSNSTDAEGQQTEIRLYQLPKIYSVTDLKYFLTT